MNNRIMAMLLALVAAMFISIVPVKAEAAVAHTHVDGNDGTYNHKCDVAGCNEVVHTAGAAWDMDENNHFKWCFSSDCSTKMEETAHTFGNYVNQGAQAHNRTCTVCGYTEAMKPHADGANKDCECDDCGADLGHTLKHIAPQAAQCEKPGVKNHYECESCGQLFWDQSATSVATAEAVVETALNHVASPTWSVDEKTGEHFHWCGNGCGTKLDKTAHTLSYVNQGAQAHDEKCAVCGYSKRVDHTEGETVDCACDACGAKLAHKLTHVENVKAICGKDGVRGHFACETCGELFWDQEATKPTTDKEVVDPALKHDWKTTYSYDNDNHWYACANEGCKVQKKDVAAHELVYTDNGDGTHSGRCKICSATPAEAQNVKHNYGKGEAIDGKVHKITCTDCGYATRQNCVDTDGKDCLCNNCGGMIHHLTAMLETVSRKEPTCTEKGNIGYHQCKTCGKIFSGSSATGYTVYTESIEIPALGHDGNGKWERDEKGHYQWCVRGQVCGTKVTDATGDKIGVAEHTYGDWAKRSNTEHDRVCSVCKYTDVAKHAYANPVEGNGVSHKVVCADCKDATRQSCYDSAEDKDCNCDACGEMMAHDRDDLEYTARHNPTCTKDGNVGYYTCKTCARNFEKVDGAFVVYEKDVVLGKLNHKWKACKDTLNGQHLEKCEREDCGAYQTLDCKDNTGDCLCDIHGCGKLIHSHKLVFHNPVAATCEVDGTEGYFTYLECDKKMFNMDMDEIAAPVKVSAPGHTPSGEWVPNEDIHEELCEKCDKVLKTEAHKDENGDNRCDSCDVALALELVPEQPATCTAVGYEECWISPVSQRMYSDPEGKNFITEREEIPALGHLETGWINNGANHKMTCQRTGCTWSTEKAHSTANSCYCFECESAISGHNLKKVSMKAATCTKTGYEAYFKCSCGKLYDMGYKKISAPVVIEKLPHDMNTKVLKDTKEGKHYIQCKNCDYRMYEAHAMVLSDPMKGNYHQWLCPCGELEIETHYDKNGDNKCDVCGHSNTTNTTATTVEQHDNETVKTGDKKTDSSKSWLQNWLESLNSNNTSGKKSSSSSTTSSSTSSTSTSKASSSKSSSAEKKTATAAASSTTTAANNSTSTSGSASTGTSTGASTTAQTSVIAQFINWFLSLFGF